VRLGKTITEAVILEAFGKYSVSGTSVIGLHGNSSVVVETHLKMTNIQANQK
jgi:hypothetical protein